ncbi:MAG: (Fe-S)-binding protein [Desulfobulbaceae bacterium]|nr:(Fe-S)-binding protein [Desulfobulbaceae bacterium]
MDTSLCAKCGTCSAVCPVYRVSGLESDTARGKLHLLGKLADSPHSSAYREIFSRCLLCGACHQACPRGLDLPALVAEARADFPRLTGSGSFSKLLATSCLAHPALLAGLAGLLRASGPLLRKLPADSGLRLKLGLFLDHRDNSGNDDSPPPAPVPNTPAPAPGGITIFSGCLAQHLRPEITKAASELLTRTDHPAPCLPKAQTCCGLAHYSAGNPAEARRLARQNLDAFADSTGPIVTPCGSCYHQLRHYPTLFTDDPVYRARARAFGARLREMSAFLVADSQTNTVPTSHPSRPESLRVFYHDPCHLRFQPELRAAPRQLLRAYPGVELVELPGGPRCCGLGGTFNLAHPDLSQRIGATLAQEITALAPDLVLTSCSGCLLQLHQALAGAGNRIPVVYLSEFLATP